MCTKENEACDDGQDLELGSAKNRKHGREIKVSATTKSFDMINKKKHERLTQKIQ